MKKNNRQWWFGLLVVFLCLTGGLLVAQDYDPSDTDSPDIVSTDPYTGQENVSTNTYVRVTFNEAMDPSSISTDTFSVADTYGETMTGLVKYSNRTAYFVPFNTMGENTTYEATVSGQVRDISGNSLGSDYSWSFSTAED